MTMRARAFLAGGLALAALFAGRDAAAQPAGTVEGLNVETHGGAPPAGDVQARAWVSQTALWPGDRITYTVEIACAPKVDVLTDDLAPEKLPLTGLEVVSSDRERGVSGAGGITYRVRHHLTTYDVADPVLRIGDHSVRYYVRRADQGPEAVAPAGEARVPGATLALRSTIPEALSVLAVRDVRPAAALPAFIERAAPLGVALVLFSALPVAMWAVAVARRIRPAARRRSARQARSAARTALDELRAIDPSSSADRIAAFGRLEDLLRRHLTETAGIPAAALTAAEISERLRESGKPLPAEAIGTALEDCERARYGPAAVLPPPDRFRADVAAAEALLRGR